MVLFVYHTRTSVCFNQFQQYQHNMYTVNVEDWYKNNYMYIISNPCIRNNLLFVQDYEVTLSIILVMVLFLPIPVSAPQRLLFSLLIDNMAVWSCHDVLQITCKIKQNEECLQQLTHWCRVTHICASKIAIIGSDNGLSPGRRQAIIWANAGILFIGPLGTKFSEISIEIHTIWFKKMHLNMSSA